MTSVIAVKFFFLEEAPVQLDVFSETLLRGLPKYGGRRIQVQSHVKYGLKFTSAENKKYCIDYAPLEREDRCTIAFEILGDSLPPDADLDEVQVSDSILRLMDWMAFELGAHTVLISNSDQILSFTGIQSLYFAFEPALFLALCSPKGIDLLQRILGTSSLEVKSESDTGNLLKFALIPDWRTFLIGNQNVPNRPYIENPYLLQFDETVLFDPSFFSFGGKSNAGGDYLSIARRLASESNDKIETIDFVIPGQPFQSDVALVLHCAFRLLANELTTYELLALLPELQDSKALSKPDRSLVAKISMLAFDHFCMESENIEIVIAVWPPPSKEREAWVFAIFPITSVDNATQDWLIRILNPIVERLGIRFGVGSFGESYRILPEYVTRLDAGASVMQLVLSDENEVFGVDLNPHDEPFLYGKSGGIDCEKHVGKGRGTLLQRRAHIRQQGRIRFCPNICVHGVWPLRQGHQQAGGSRQQRDLYTGTAFRRRCSTEQSQYFVREEPYRDSGCCREDRDAWVLCELG